MTDDNEAIPFCGGLTYGEARKRGILPGRDPWPNSEPQTGPTAMEALYDVRHMLTGTPPHRPRREINFTLDYRPMDPDLMAQFECLVPRPRPTVFDRSRGQRWLLWLSLLALVAIAAWIIVGVGR